MRYETPTGAGAVRLHLNENSAGCSPRVIGALRSITPADIATYPDYAPITSKVEQWFGVAPGWVQLVNGLDEGLHLAAAAAVRLGSTALYPAPAFEMYRVCAEEAGLTVVTVPPANDFTFPLDDIVIASERAAIIYLTDPNNPTGLGIPDGAVETIAASAPRSLVVVDEAYADFSGRTLIGPLLERRRNVVIGRTFAKGHGLAGLRIGALVAHPDTLAPIRARLAPFTMNIAAVRALDAALDDEPWLRACVVESSRSRELIYAFCESHSFRYWRSEANFVLLRVGPDASAIVSALAERGILIRDRSMQPGCEGCVRISAGTIDATTRCLTALEDILATRNN
jgi:histidinol-phosphate aminotransferase